MVKQSSTASSFPSTNTLLTLGIVWGLMALMFFLFFSVPQPGQDRPQWYLDGITILETGAFLFSSFLCFRNWKSEQIVSGRTVWLWIGLGLMSYAFGNLMFYLWGNVWGQDPAVSPGDAFYLLSYVFLALGMFQAVLPRRLNLDPRQWLLVAVIGLLGIGIAFFLKFGGLNAVAEEIGGTVPEPAPPAEVNAANPAAPAPAIAPETEEAANAPAWVISLDEQLTPFESIVSLLYVLGDCLLLVVAATLLVAFWGGRFSQSWKLIAIAALCLYIADMFFLYSVNQADYQEGSLWEVFWTFSAVFFGLGAVVEYAISMRSRRTARRRRA